MKRKFIYAFALLMAFSSLLAQNKDFNFTLQDPVRGNLDRDLSIYTTEPIYDAPEGTEYANMLRIGYSYYLENGYVYGGPKDGKLGNIVMGNDGNIYLKQPFSSLDLNTYLLLEPVDDTTFVAHTPQCVYMENNYGQMEYVYATRVVYTQVNDNQFTYAPEETADGYNTDMIFIYKDGVLSQYDDGSVIFNGEKYPSELLAATNSNGGWFGIGDGSISLSPMTETPVELPEGVVSAPVTMIYQVLNTVLEAAVDHPAMSEYAEVGNEVYLKLPFKYNDNGFWVKGTINDSGTISFEKQYLGVDEEHACHLWMMPATYRDTIVVWDVDFHECWRTYEEVDKIVFNRNGEYIQSETPFSMLINSSSINLDIASSLSDPRTSLYTEEPATPITPYFTGVCEYDGFLFGYFIFNTPNISVDGSYIEPDSMYYNVFINGSTEPYTFTPENYSALSESITDVPYSFDDDQDICFMGYSHQIFFYWPWESIGIRSIYKYNGEVYYSDIKWHNKPNEGEGLTAPINVVAEGVSDTKLGLSWEAVEGAVSYGIYIEDEFLGVTEYTSAVITGCEPNTTYCCTVTAFDADENESEHSEEACATTLDSSEVVVPPTNIVAEATGPYTIRLSWDAVDDALAYGVFYEGTWLGATYDTFMELEELEAETEYCFTVITITEITDNTVTGYSDESEPVCATTTPDGLAEFSTAFNIYPNPVNDVIFVENGSNIEQVTIHTVTGVMVYSQECTSNNVQINVTDLESGVYIIKVKTENKEIINRFVKK